MDREDFRLTGGVFFALFFHACKDLSEQKSFAIKDANKGPIPTVMDELLYVMTGEHEKRASQAQQTFKDNVSKYRFCKVDSRAHIKIGINDAISLAFDQLVKQNYEKALCRMREVVNGYLHDTIEIRLSLVKGLMELISLDKSLKGKLLYVAGKEAVSVEKITELHEIDLAAFLLGVWHYCTCGVNNTEGKDTIDVLCPQRGGNPRDYVGDLGNKVSAEFEFLELCQDKVEDDIFEKESEPERVEAEVVDSVDEEHEEKKSQKEAPRANTFTFNFNVTGNNNSFYNHVDTVNNYYGGKKNGQ